MMEVGPWRVDGQGGFKTIEGGWEEYTTMVYSECYHFRLSNPSLSFACSRSACRHWIFLFQHRPLRPRFERGLSTVISSTPF